MKRTKLKKCVTVAKYWSNKKQPEHGKTSTTEEWECEFCEWE